jgi:chaperonin GroEL (HSP60 family)
MAAFQLFGDGLRRSTGNQARRYNLLAARLIAELVKNSLGPRGMEKMFVDILGEVTVTKDGATLLRKIDVEHPAAKVLIEASQAPLCKRQKNCLTWASPPRPSLTAT